MEIKKIKSQEDYDKAIAYLEDIGDRDDFENMPDLVAQFELISELIAIYEKENFRIENGHPLDIIKLKMDSLGISRRDLIPLIGSSGVVSDIFNKKRGLSKSMIRNFSVLLHIDQDILNTKYELERPVKTSVEQRVKITFPFIKPAQQKMINRFRGHICNSGLVFDIAC